ncbi:MAG: hypothetical protein ACRCYS_11020 [Beijerinckiaceae bacterium]
MIHFSTGDPPTDHNLQRLSHLASHERFDDGPVRMNDWLCAVIQSIELLPKAARHHFKGDYYLGDTHFRMSVDRRTSVWRQLAEELQKNVEAAHVDTSLRKTSDQCPDVSDRRQSRGERIIELCERLDVACCGTQEFSAILNMIGALAVGDIGPDVRELKRLSSLKRIGDMSSHQYWVARHIAHIRLVAARLHHLAA